MDSNPKLSALSPIKFNGYDETSCAGFARTTRPYTLPPRQDLSLLASFFLRKYTFLAPSTPFRGAGAPAGKTNLLAAPPFHGLLVVAAYTCLCARRTYTYNSWMWCRALPSYRLPSYPCSSTAGSCCCCAQLTICYSTHKGATFPTHTLLCNFIPRLPFEIIEYTVMYINIYSIERHSTFRYVYERGNIIREGYNALSHIKLFFFSSPLRKILMAGWVRVLIEQAKLVLANGKSWWVPA